MSETGFLSGPITLPLVRFTVPLAGALVLQALYGAVDMAVVGHLGTTVDVAAVGSGSLLMTAVTAVIAGLSVGVTVRLGHCIGARALHRAAQALGGTVWLFGLGALALTGPLILGAPWIMRLMQVPEEALAPAVAYVRICSGGLVFISAYNAVSAVFRGLGDSRSPLLFVAVACGVNVVGDLVFVGPLGMGAAGAAWATVLSQAVSVVFSVVYIRRRGLPFRFGRKHLLVPGDAMRRILAIGGPVASQDLLNYLSFMILTAIMNSLGLLASAAAAIESKVFAFFILVPTSFMSALSAFVAQNVGAGQEERAVAALKRAMAMAFGVGLISFCAAFFFGEVLASLFNNDPLTTRATARLLKGASGEHLIFSVVFCFLGFFNGKAMTVFTVIQGAVCAFLVRLPLAYEISRKGSDDLLPVGLALSASAAVALVLCAGYFLWKEGYAAPALRRLKNVLRRLRDAHESPDAG